MSQPSQHLEDIKVIKKDNGGVLQVPVAQRLIRECSPACFAIARAVVAKLIMPASELAGDSI
ncbi:MAG: hypothetical protein MZV63_25285 [Marinilabiliales bacterium]|nr:hypothetical protein [Marinilabiliales bacterium]